MTSATSPDVAILGYGPAGALLANLLGQAGLSVAVYERDTAIHALPRAVHFDGEVMRIFQSVGLAEKIAAMTHGISASLSRPSVPFPITSISHW